MNNSQWTTWRPYQPSVTKYSPEWSCTYLLIVYETSRLVKDLVCDWRNLNSGRRCGPIDYQDGSDAYTDSGTKVFEISRCPGNCKYHPREHKVIHTTMSEIGGLFWRNGLTQAVDLERVD